MLSNNYLTSHLFWCVQKAVQKLLVVTNYYPPLIAKLLVYVLNVLLYSFLAPSNRVIMHNFWLKILSVNSDLVALSTQTIKTTKLNKLNFGVL